MARPILFFLLLLPLLLSLTAAAEKGASYIVHMAKTQMPSGFTQHSDWYEASLRSISDSAHMLYTYNTVAHGFSARLMPVEVRALARRPGVVSIHPDTRYQLHTTRSPEFLGLSSAEELLPKSDNAVDIIIGILDTGVWPERKSFDDTGFGTIPAGWKGQCASATGFDPAMACNRKLIGAKFFSKGYESSMGPIDESIEPRSPRDVDGHGTHTSTTAAGSAVSNASLLGYAMGTARGMNPRARIAVYKVCWSVGCYSSDILAAMDAAVDDGCHVLSLSLGGSNTDYYRDIISIGAFNAMERGVLVSCSAGNSGPGASTVSNLAPWITTVGAGTLDRDFPSYVVLGNGKNYSGISLYSGKPLPSALPFVYAGNATNSSSGNLCFPGTLVPEKVAGKLVFCERGINSRVQKGMVVKEAGGAGMVLTNTAENGEELVADAHILPATLVGEKAGKEIKAYSISHPNPTATIIFCGTKVGVRPAPVVAAFSSRGPNPVTPEILKPDLIAPGVNILAGWTGAVGPTGLQADSRRVEFNIISGTSMSCPHVSGLAALLKEAHPDWSPAAIKSALMTTAYVKYPGGDGGILDIETGKAATPFDFGAGHVDPRRAMDPGLIYDLATEDYLDFLCALDYTPLQIAAVTKGRNFSCDAQKNYTVSNLNYPSFSVTFSTAAGGEGGEDRMLAVTHERTVTNVGMPPATYNATAMVKVDGGEVNITVQPAVLSFTDIGEKKSYTVKFTAPSLPSGSSGSGQLEWSDGKHIVSSMIVFSWP